MHNELRFLGFDLYAGKLEVVPFTGIAFVLAPKAQQTFDRLLAVYHLRTSHKVRSTFLACS
jgi:hypothetical protein